MKRLLAWTFAVRPVFNYRFTPSLFACDLSPAEVL
jgi:hypothetical protein